MPEENHAEDHAEENISADEEETQTSEASVSG